VKILQSLADTSTADKLGVVSSARDEMDEMRSNLGFVSSFSNGRRPKSSVEGEALTEVTGTRVSWYSKFATIRDPSIN